MGKDKKPQAQPKALGIDDQELYDIRCTICRENKVLTDGDFHCKHCGVMCENCSEKHQKTPRQVGHWAQKIKRIRQDYEQPYTFTSIKKCEKHPKRNIKGYCIDHGEVICTECKNERHFDCTDETVEVMSEDLKKDTEMVEARNELADLNRRTKRVGKNKKEEIIRMAKQADEFEQYLRKMKDNVIAMFDKMLTAILREKDEFCKKESVVIDKDVEKCLSYTPIFDLASKQLDDVYRSGSLADMWVALKKAERLVTHYDEIITGMENDKVNVKFEFVPNIHLAGLLDEPDNVGKIKITSSRLHGTNTTLNNNLVDPKTGKKSSFTLPWMSRHSFIYYHFKETRLVLIFKGKPPSFDDYYKNKLSRT